MWGEFFFWIAPPPPPPPPPWKNLGWARKITTLPSGLVASLPRKSHSKLSSNVGSPVYRIWNPLLRLATCQCIKCVCVCTFVSRVSCMSVHLFPVFLSLSLCCVFLLSCSFLWLSIYLSFFLSVRSFLHFSIPEGKYCLFIIKLC